MRHEEILRTYGNHVLINRRGMGSVRRLVGSIDVIVFFVNDSQSTWTELAKRRYRAAQKEAMQKILHSARARGVSLQIRNAYVDASVSMNCTPEQYTVWANLIIRKYGVPDVAAYQAKHRAVMKCAEAPIIFAFNKPFRCRAASADLQSWQAAELALISSQYTAGAIMHELLHQFGAVDYYYPEVVSNLIRRMRYKSVMDDCDTMYIDSLTAYLIGWTNEIDAAAVRILEGSRHLTREGILAAIRQQYENP